MCYYQHDVFPVSIVSASQPNSDSSIMPGRCECGKCCIWGMPINFSKHPNLVIASWIAQITKLCTDSYFLKNLICSTILSCARHHCLRRCRLLLTLWHTAPFTMLYIHFPSFYTQDNSMSDYFFVPEDSEVCLPATRKYNN